MHADLFEALADASEDARLVAAFGRSGYFWSDLAPQGDPLPRAVYADITRAVEDELLQAPGQRTAIIGGTFQVIAYAPARVSSRVLGRLLAEVFEERAASGGLVFAEGKLTDLRRTGLETTELDPDLGPGGVPVWSHLVQFGYSLVESNV